MIRLFDGAWLTARGRQWSAMEHLHDPLVDGVAVEPFAFRLGPGLEHAPVVAGHHLGQPGDGARPVVEQVRGDLGAGLLVVSHHEGPELMGHGVWYRAEV